VDVRVVAATNKPLEAEVQERRFRRDLYYRLNVLSIAIPPLRERSDDLLLLARTFLVEAEREVGRCGLCLGADALEALRAHAWPGNVRELRNVILRAAATAAGPEIRARDLQLDPAPPREPGATPAEPGATPAPPERTLAPPGSPRGVTAETTLQATIREREREALVGALDAMDWNFARAAQRLGISRMTLYRRLSKLGIARASRAP